jgi:hypothetical protein
MSVILSVILTRQQLTDGHLSVGMDIGDCGISSNYFQTLCEMPTDIYPSVWTSVIVVFQVIIFELSMKCRRTYSVGIDVGDCGISSNYFMLQNISSMIYNYFK